MSRRDDIRFQNFLKNQQRQRVNLNKKKPIILPKTHELPYQPAALNKGQATKTQHSMPKLWDEGKRKNFGSKPGPELRFRKSTPALGETRPPLPSSIKSSPTGGRLNYGTNLGGIS